MIWVNTSILVLLRIRTLERLSEGVQSNRVAELVDRGWVEFEAGKGYVITESGQDVLELHSAKEKGRGKLGRQSHQGTR